MNNLRKTRVYIAAPFSKGNTAENIRRVVFIAEKLQELGYSPFLPHLSHLWQIISPHEIQFWYDYDNEWLLSCDVVLRLPGESQGADAEELLAENNSIPIYYSLEELTSNKSSESINEYLRWPND